ncbi:MAG TPA: hypothetical protein VG916_10910, partial [Gemmatimonadaceae bacterium]|nr:hypothetical protein [Gemmatimonadaceae bacterium]
MRHPVRVLANGRFAAALALGAAVAACGPAEPHGLGPEQRTAGVIRPGMTLVIDDRGTPAV